MLEIGPNLQTFLLALVASAIPAAVTIATLWFQSRKDRQSRDVQLGEIHEAVDGSHSAVVNQVKELKGAMSDMLKDNTPAQQASADRAGDNALKK